MTTWTVTQDGIQIAAFKLADADAAAVAQWAVSEAASILVSPAVPDTAAVNAVFDKTGNVLVAAIPYGPGRAAIYRDPTPSEAMGALAQKFLSGLADSTTQHLKAKAAAEAANTVAAITPV